jgi:alpha-L-rhamnosidase
MENAPWNLRTEDMVRPLAIDTRAPRFSWRPPDAGERGARQTAWQVECVDAGGGPVWDSGKRPGGDLAVEYGGEALRSFSLYRWRLRSWDAGGARGADSAWAAFETAALDPGDLTARWITHPSPTAYREGSWESGVPNEQSSPEKSVHYMGIYCAKAFALGGRKVRRARALVAGVGACALFVNGGKAHADILSPPQTDYAKRVLYSVYDITPLLAPAAEEQCVALALGNGRHIALYGFGRPRGYVQILLEAEDGSVEWVRSDGTWTAGEGPVRENSIFNGERYDARLGVPACAGDLRGAARAVVVDGYPLCAARIPPITVEREIAPVRAWRAGDGFMYDFGQNFSGAARLRLSVPRGTEIRMSFAELAHADGTLNPASNRAARSSDSYVARGEPGETWQPSMTYHGFRYMLLEGFPCVPPSDAVTGVFFHTEAEREGDFSCSHALFNDIHRNILWGQLSNLMGLPTDSPQRDERHGWLGDALLSSEECILNFGAVGFWEKFIQDIVDTQMPDGSITDVAPKFWMSKPADPAWGSALISISWSLYRFKGDVALLRKHYPAFTAYIGYLERAAEGFLIEKLGTFGDWCAPGMVYPKKTNPVFTSSWYFQHDCGLLADIAEALGQTADCRRFRGLQGRIVAAMNARFRKGARYETQAVTPWDFPDQTSQAMALCSPLVEEGERAAVAATLDRLVTTDSGDHVGCGIHGARYLLHALTEGGYAEKAFTVAAQETFPGWGYMVREGATTLWERWEKIESPGMNSHNHIMLGSIDVWFYESVAGMAVSRTDWRRLLFTPGLFQRIGHAYARMEVPAGAASISWRRRTDAPLRAAGGRGITVEIRVPPGCTGTLCVPDGFALTRLRLTPSCGREAEIPVPSGGTVELDSGWYTAELGG